TAAAASRFRRRHPPGEGCVRGGGPRLWGRRSLARHAVRSRATPGIERRSRALGRGRRPPSVVPWRYLRPRLAAAGFRRWARLSMLPESVKEGALRKLEAWAGATFGSLDAVSSERHEFELRVYKFRERAGC